MKLDKLKKNFESKYDCKLDLNTLLPVKFFLAYYIHAVLNKIDILRTDKFRRKNISDFENKFKTISIDSSNYFSKLCFLGGKFGSDKSVFCTKTPYKHSYTAVYNILFSHLKNNQINFAEIGILQNASVKMWREFFTNANIDGFEFNEDLIITAENEKLKNTKYFKIDVRNRESIKKSFLKTNKEYDVIIDDSTHIFNDQINIIFTAKNFLKPGGYLIIEDIFSKKTKYSEKNYYQAIKEIKSEFSDIFFINCSNKYNYGGLFFNHKVLVLIKNNHSDNS